MVLYCGTHDTYTIHVILDWKYNDIEGCENLQKSLYLKMCKTSTQKSKNSITGNSLQKKQYSYPRKNNVPIVLVHRCRDWSGLDFVYVKMKLDTTTGCFDMENF